MIVKLKGKCIKKNSDKIYVDTGSITYEVLVPYTVFLRIEDGRDLDLFIYHYFQSDNNKSFPVFIGFLNELEKEFVEKFISVSGIGPKAAVKAINKSISDIAFAIDNADLGFLKSLPGIGLQRAKNIVAVLQGKMGKFVLIKDKIPADSTALSRESLNKHLAEDALKVLESLQYSRKEAQTMVKKALNANPSIETVEDLLTEIYRSTK